MHVIITNLQKSRLLLKLMTSKGENPFMVKSWLKQWPRSESFRCYTAISLIKSKINIFPNKLEFPYLKTFLIDYDYNYDNWSLVTIP
ncbi:hypothetical protein QQP08_021027, partial [Theobroma cacao]